MAFNPLPAYNVGNALDFSGLNQAVNNWGERRQQNAMMGYRQEQDAIQNNRANAMLGLQQQQNQRAQTQFDDKRGQEALNELAGVYQMIDQAPEAERAALYSRVQPLYSRLRTRIPDFDTDLQAMGVDPNDHVAVGKLVMGRARGYQNPLETQKAQADIDLKNAQAGYYRERPRTAAGGATTELIDRVMAANPNMSLEDAITLVKRGGGITIVGDEALNRNTAETVRNVGSAIAGAEKAKKIGQYEGEAPQRDAGKQRLNSIMSGLVGNYLELDRRGAIVNPQRSGGDNFSARVGASGIGQELAGAAGTEAQSIRQRIENARPLLLQAIMQATGMSARALDSNKELDFYLQAVSDPKRDLYSNLAAIDALDKAFGLGGLLKSQLPPELYAKISVESDRQLMDKPINVQNQPANGGFKYLGPAD